MITPSIILTSHIHVKSVLSPHPKTIMLILLKRLASFYCTNNMDDMLNPRKRPRDDSEILEEDVKQKQEKHDVVVIDGS